MGVPENPTEKKQDYSHIPGSDSRISEASTFIHLKSHTLEKTHAVRIHPQCLRATVKPLKNDSWKTILSFWGPVNFLGKKSGAMLDFQGVGPEWRVMVVNRSETAADGFSMGFRVTCFFKMCVFGEYV